MRKHTTVAALAAISALALAACSSAEPGADTGSDPADDGAGGGDTLRIGIKYDQPGLGLQKGADFVGFDVDVAKYVAGELGYEEDQLEFIEAVSANRETMLQNGDVDMILATYSITEEREEVVDFAGPYFVAGQDLLVASDDDSISGPEDLEGKNLCSVTGSTSAARIKDDFATGVELVERPGYAECLTALSSGAVDAVTTDDIILAGLAAAQEDPSVFKVVGNPFSEENYGVGLPEGSDQCEAIDEAITAMISDGTWDDLVATHTDGTGYEANAELNPPEPNACA